MSDDIEWYITIPQVDAPLTKKIAKCRDCGREIIMQDKLDWMRKKGAFTKYCSTCGETFGSDDIEEFMKMLKNHKCKR